MAAQNEEMTKEQKGALFVRFTLLQTHYQYANVSSKSLTEANKKLSKQVELEEGIAHGARQDLLVCLIHYKFSKNLSQI